MIQTKPTHLIVDIGILSPDEISPDESGHEGVVALFLLVPVPLEGHQGLVHKEEGPQVFGVGVGCLENLHQLFFNATFQKHVGRRMRSVKKKRREEKEEKRKGMSEVENGLNHGSQGNPHLPPWNKKVITRAWGNRILTP